MANADKVWQGLSASDVVGNRKQCCYKPLSRHQSIEVLSDVLFCQLIPSTNMEALCGNDDSSIHEISTRVVSRCVPMLTLHGPYKATFAALGRLRRHPKVSSDFPTDFVDDDHSDLVIVAGELWL
jgi:hypothetical protein